MAYSNVPGYSILNSYAIAPPPIVKTITFSGAGKVRDHIFDFHDSAIPLPALHARGIIEPRVYCSTVHNSQAMKSSQVFPSAYIEVLRHNRSYSVPKKSEAVSFATK